MTTANNTVQTINEEMSSTVFLSKIRSVPEVQEHTRMFFCWWPSLSHRLQIELTRMPVMIGLL